MVSQGVGRGPGGTCRGPAGGRCGEKIFEPVELSNVVLLLRSERSREVLCGETHSEVKRGKAKVEAPDSWEGQVRREGVGTALCVC